MASGVESILVLAAALLHAQAVPGNLVYDALNRPTLKSYNDNPVTPAVRFCYDGTHSALGAACAAPSTAVGNAIGRLTAVSNSLSSSLMLSFDPLGRVLGSRQVTPAASQPITADLGYTYTASGQSKELTLPSGRKVTYLYDNAGRLQATEGDKLLRGTDCYEPSAPSKEALIYPLKRVSDGLH